MTITVENTTTQRSDYEVVVRVRPANAPQLLGGLVLLGYERIDTVILDRGAVRISRPRTAAPHKRATDDTRGTFMDIGGKVEFVLTADGLGYATKTVAEYCYQGFAADHIHIACSAPDVNELGEVELVLAFDNATPSPPI